MPSPTTHNPASVPYGGANPVSDASASGDEKLLERIRTRFRYMQKRFEKIQAAGDADMQALGPEGPWDPKERKARKKQNRPCIHLDQLNQYPNTLVNQFRQNPIGVRVKPGGNGSNDKTSTLRGDRIRAIEYESNASEAYETALRCAAERGYGVITLETEEIAWDGWDQRIKIVREPDPNAVLWDPDAKESDSSDIQDGFKLWQLPVDEFKRRFPNASIVDQNLGDCAILAPGWINVERQTVQVAKYSYYETTERHLYLLDDGSPQGLKVFKDEVGRWKEKDGYLTHDGRVGPKILKQKKAVQKRVMQCLTNGVEILERTAWAGKWIPIFPMLGKEKYVRTIGEDGQPGVTERVLESQIRGAIDGQRGFDSAATNQVETSNMVPKAIYMMYEGQEDTATDWQNINKIVTPYGLVKPIVDAATGQVLPLPQRLDWNPQIEPMEVLKESNRRAMQAAIGSHGFTINDDTNVKSGKAVNSLKAQSDVGNYHFAANAKNTVRHLLRAVNDLLDKVEDTSRDVGLRHEDGSHEMVRINEQTHDPKTKQQIEHRYTPLDPETGKPMADASHEVLISTGPSFETQRDEASSFVEGLLDNEAIGPRVADLAIKWRDLGPYGDQMAERVTLPEFQKQDGQADIPPQVKQKLGQLQQQNQELVTELQRLLQEREAKTAEIESKERIAAMDAQVKILDIQERRRAKEIDAAIKGMIVHEQLTTEENIREAELQAERQIAELSHDMDMAAQQAGADQDAAQSEQDHEQGLEAGAVGHDQALEQQYVATEGALKSQTQAEAAAAEQSEPNE